ncbi:MAG: glycosyltransferase [Planctomycetes bacterium]|nr:glycosyltransferase [Planctomycetota bacterium]
MSDGAAPSPYDVSVVVACYREASHLRDSVAQLAATLAATGRAHELVFVEDASDDGTPAIVADLVAAAPHRRAVYHARNVGRGGSVAEGFRLATGRIVGFLDIDLEVHCRHLPELLAAIDAGADGATALRHYDLDWRPRSLWRVLLSRGYRWLFGRLFDVPFRDPEAGFKFFVRDRILPVVAETRDRGWFWDSEILVLAHRAGLRIAEVPCRFERRHDKASTVRPLRDVWRYLVAIRAFRARLRGAVSPGAGGSAAAAGDAHRR